MAILSYSNRINDEQGSLNIKGSLVPILEGCLCNLWLLADKLSIKKLETLI
jgi:hypothetical protein